MESVKDFSVSQLVDYLEVNLDGKVFCAETTASIFEQHRITGLVFLTLTNEELVSILGDGKPISEFLAFVKEMLTGTSGSSKVI